MIYKQLGNGGAFNFEKTNSAFLVENILVDCGYSVYAELRRQDTIGEINLQDIKSVYITHLDDDHIGSLKTFLYYQFFVNKITMNVLYDERLKDLETYINLEEFNKTIENFEFKKTEIAKLIPISGTIFHNGMNLRTFQGEHHIPVFGIVFDEILAITGDTKPTSQIEEELKDVKIIFHDFSNWNEPSRQTHTCLDSLQIYSKEFKEKLKFYHNDEKFNKNWRIIEK